MARTKQQTPSSILPAGDLVALIRKIRLFSDLRDDDVTALAPSFTIRDVPKGGEIFDQDEPAQEIFLIIEGRVRIYRKAEDGREITLSFLQEGSFFGEISIFTGEPRSAAAAAAESTRLLVLTRADFVRTVLLFPHIGAKIIEALSRRLLEADRTIASLLWSNAYQKILLTLKRLAQTEGVARGDAVVIRRRVTHQEIADMAGTSRETASRILVQLKNVGAVVPSGRHVIIRESSFPEELDP
jgi:CRP/FNR family cyclic AMP-dependent transcriptional regulator